MKRLWRWTPVIVLLIFVGAAIIYSESLKTKIAIGAKAPEFELELLEGGAIRSKQLLGKPALVNFWAAWCPPCLEEMPAHNEFFRRYGHRIAYVAVNERETVARIQRHLDEVAELGLEMNLPIALDRRGTVGEAFRIGGLPETWLLDPQGVARQHWIGTVNFEQLAAGYRSVMGHAPDEPDGGPFHGTENARAVLMSDPTVRAVYVGGLGGVARYEVGEGPVAGSRFTWVSRDDAFALSRDLGATAGVGTAADVAWDGLPGPPTNVARGPGGRMLAWVPEHGLFAASEDNGRWRLTGANLPPSMPSVVLAPDPLTEGHWLVAASVGLLESRDGGGSWQATGFKSRAHAVVFDPVAPRRIYVAAQDGVYVSDDGGRTASRLPASPQRQLIALDVLPDGKGQSVLLAAAPNGDVYVGKNSGRQWEALIPGRVSND